MLHVVILLFAGNLVVCALAVMRHANRARRRATWLRAAASSTPGPVLPDTWVSEDLRDYVGRGLDDLTVMLVHAARRSPS